MRWFPGKKYFEYHHKNLQGIYEYTGEYVDFEGEDSVLKKKKRLLWIIWTIATCLTVVSGCIDAAGMASNAYTVVPLAVEVIIEVIYSIYLYRFTSDGNPIKEYTWKYSVKKLAPLSICIASTGAICLITSIIYVILNGFDEKMIATIIYMVLKIAIISAGVLSLLIHRSIVWKNK